MQGAARACGLVAVSGSDGDPDRIFSSPFVDVTSPDEEGLAGTAGLRNPGCRMMSVAPGDPGREIRSPGSGVVLGKRRQHTSEDMGATGREVAGLNVEDRRSRWDLVRDATGNLAYRRWNGYDDRIDRLCRRTDFVHNRDVRAVRSRMQEGVGSGDGEGGECGVEGDRAGGGLAIPPGDRRCVI